MISRKLKVLVIDDEQDLCELMERIFKKKGFRAYSATSSKKAISIATRIKPDIAFVDLYFSRGKDGLRIIDELKKVVPKCLPVMMTWDKSEDKVREAKRRGVVYYLVKPITVAALEKVINKLTKRI